MDRLCKCQKTVHTVSVAAVLLTSACCHLWLLLLLQDILWWALYKAEAVLLGSRLRKAALTEVSGMCKRRILLLSVSRGGLAYRPNVHAQLS